MKTLFSLREIADRLDLSYRTVLRYSIKPGPHLLGRRMSRGRVLWTRGTLKLFQEMYEKRRNKAGRKKKPRKPKENFRW